MVTYAYLCYPPPSLGSPQLGLSTSEKQTLEPVGLGLDIPTSPTPPVTSSDPLINSERIAAIRLFLKMANHALLRHYINLALLFGIGTLIFLSTHTSQARSLRYDEPITGQ